MFLTRTPQRNSRRYRGATDLTYGACDLVTEGGQRPEYHPTRVIEVRDAVREDAPAACEVIRRSISELCEADHRNDPEILRRWLANKTPEIVGSWIIKSGNSVLVAVDDNSTLAVGAVTGAGEITLNYVSPDARFRGVSWAMLTVLEDSYTP